MSRECDSNISFIPIATVNNPGIVQLSNILNEDQTKALTPFGAYRPITALQELVANAQDRGQMQVGKVISNTELTIKAAGNYVWSADSNIGDMPTVPENPGEMIVISRDDQIGTRIVIDSKTRRIFFRSFTADSETPWDEFVTTNSMNLIPSIPRGIIVDFSGLFGGSDGYRPLAGDLLPDETWHLCNGLNGTPDLRGLMIMSGDGTNTGETGGSTVTQNHTLSVAQLASHNHGYSSWTSNHGYTDGYGNAVSGCCGASTGHTGSNHGHSHGQNLPPYYTLAKIMKL